MTAGPTAPDTTPAPAGLRVGGGAGGTGAYYDDLGSEARVLDLAGDGVRARAGDVGRLAVDGDVLAAAVLCPLPAGRLSAGAGEVAAVLLGLSVRLEGTAIVLRATVQAYESMDAVRARVLDVIAASVGWSIGKLLPLVVVAGGSAVLVTGVMALDNPVLRRLLADPRMRAALTDAAREGALTALFDNPWLTEGLTATAPWMVQGAGSTFMGGPTPHGFLLMSLLSGGKWPSGDYTDAVGGLVAVGQRFGMFHDTGDVGVRRLTEPLEGAAAPGSVGEVFDQQGNLSEDGHHGTIQIVRVAGDDGVRRWIVQIPGTQEWSPVRGDNPVDLTTNVALMSGQHSFLQEHIAAAMRDIEVPAGDPVMLTGHSQGGITAAALASDPAFTARFNVTAVVTGGSPIARFDIPPHISVLALEHDQDPVPMLEGRANPDRANWVTVNRDLAGHDEVADPGAAHETRWYGQTGRMVDGSDDPSIRAWREQTAGFFDPTGEVELHHYRVAGGTSSPTDGAP